jgi:hypothetical protein
MMSAVSTIKNANWIYTLAKEKEVFETHLRTIKF